MHEMRQARRYGDPELERATRSYAVRGRIPRVGSLRGEMTMPVEFLHGRPLSPEELASPLAPPRSRSRTTNVLWDPTTAQPASTRPAVFRPEGLALTAWAPQAP